LNLIIHDYPEPSSRDPLARKKEGIKNISTCKGHSNFYSLAVFAWFSKLLDEYVEVPAMITYAIRIGKKSDGLMFTKVIVSCVKEKSYIIHDHCN